MWGFLNKASEAGRSFNTKLDASDGYSMTSWVKDSPAEVAGLLLDRYGLGEFSDDQSVAAGLR